jgi:hypothetical protein
MYFILLWPANNNNNNMSGNNSQGTSITGGARPSNSKPSLSSATSFSDVVVQPNQQQPSQNYNVANVNLKQFISEPMYDDDDDNNNNNDDGLFKKVRFTTRSPGRSSQCADPEDEEERFNESRHKRPVTTIPALRQAFENDPKSAIKNNVPVHTSNKDLDNYRREILDIAANKKQQNEVADELWADDDYSFIKMVEGLSLDKTLSSRDTTVPVAGHSAGALMQTGPAAESFVPAALTLNPEKTNAYAFLDQFFSSAYDPNQKNSYNSQYIKEVDKLRILENIDKVIDLPQVSGTVQMSSLMYASIMEALSSLTMVNRDKYLHKDRSHFYKDLAVKTLFAKLVYAFICEAKVMTPNQYYGDKGISRRDAKTHFALNNLDNHIVWDSKKCHFVYAETHHTDAIKKAKRCKFLSTFDVDALC